MEGGAQVHALTSTVSSVYPVRLVELRDRITLHGGNLNDSGAMASLVGHADPDVVFHLGAYTHVGKSWERVDECIQTNIHGTVNLLQALTRSRIPALRLHEHQRGLRRHPGPLPRGRRGRTRIRRTR